MKGMMKAGCSAARLLPLRMRSLEGRVKPAGDFEGIIGVRYRYLVALERVEWSMK